MRTSRCPEGTYLASNVLLLLCAHLSNAQPDDAPLDASGWLPAGSGPDLDAIARAYTQDNATAAAVAAQAACHPGCSHMSTRERLLLLQHRNPACHNEAHPLGRSLYAETRFDADEALRLCEYRCNGGCVHGIIEALVEHMSPSASPSAVPSPSASGEYALTRTIRNGSAASRAVAQLLRSPLLAQLPGETPGDAAHGIGHAIGRKVAGAPLFDFGQSLHFCEDVGAAVGGAAAHERAVSSGAASSRWPADLPAAHTVSSACAGGLAMEMVMDGRLRSTPYVESARECASWPAFARGACIGYVRGVAFERSCPPPLHDPLIVDPKPSAPRPTRSATPRTRRAAR